MCLDPAGRVRIPRVRFRTRGERGFCAVARFLRLGSVVFPLSRHLQVRRYRAQEPHYWLHNEGSHPYSVLRGVPMRLYLRVPLVIVRHEWTALMNSRVYYPTADVHI